MKWSVSHEWIKKFAWFPLALTGRWDYRKIAWLEFVWVKYNINMGREVMSLTSMTESKRIEDLIQSDKDRFGDDPYQEEY